MHTCIPVLLATHVEPGDMNTSLPAESDLGDANGTIGYNAPFCHVHTHGLGPLRRSGLPGDIREIAACTCAFENDKMYYALTIHRGTWLDATVRRA